MIRFRHPSAPSQPPRPQRPALLPVATPIGQRGLAVRPEALALALPLLDRGWHFDLVPLPDGRSILTLRDAGQTSRAFRVTATPEAAAENILVTLDTRSDSA